ncbi:uncharacterized protein isoform X5 [Leptinotarsa decemlineata]|uniref:uncharacterized protein isoform X5 n=1 Tax=Leptinotarsa decemlineata TaxID=7539 RepID=UPI003D30BE5B
MASHRTFCSVDSCDSLRENISFFRFPKDATRCQQWKKAFGFVGDHKYANLTPEQAYIRIRVCRKHFDDESFTSSGKHLLTTAVPSKFPTKLDGNDQNNDNPGPSSVLASSKLDACTQTDTCQEVEQDVSCQTSSKLSDSSPRKQELRRRIKELQSELKSSKRRKTVTREDVEQFLDEQYPQEATMLMKNQLTLLDKNPKGASRPDDGAEIKSEPDDQILQPVPECSSRNPEEYLPENPPIANHAKDVAKQSIPKRHFGKVVCRMCLESAAKTQMVPLTTWDVNYAGRSEAYKQNKILQTERVNSMINVVMPNFDFDIAYNPMICHKCVARLESAFNFIEECKESEKVIHSYKTKFASHQELVSCDDVAQNRRLLEKEESRRKRRKSSKQHDNDRLVTSSPLGQNESISAGDTSQVEVHEFERVDCGESQESITMETNSEIMTSIKSEREDLECDDSEGNSFLINTADLTSVIVKEEVSVKEEVPCDFNDLPTNDQHCDLIVKDEAYSLTIAYGTDENDEYHRDSALSRKRKEMDPGT